jgi:hypothetical protein
MKIAASVILLCSIISIAQAQLDSLDFGNTPEKIMIRSAFNGSTIVNNQSTNVCDHGQLNVLIGHRFGTVNQGVYNFFGMDEAVMRLGFEYGINNNFTAGVGRFSLGKNYDGYLKYRILTQSKGLPNHNTPVTITLFSSAAFSSEKLKMQNKVNDRNNFIPNLTYSYQVVISKEILPEFALQLSPVFVHKNQTELASEVHNVYALGAAARFTLTGRLHLNFEYNYVWDKKNIAANKIYNPIGIGLDVVTGGHVFKLHFTNSAGIIEKEYLLNTTDNFLKGRIRFGFTLLRSFMLKPVVKGGSIR